MRPFRVPPEDRRSDRAGVERDYCNQACCCDVGVPVTSGAEEMVPTGGELTLFQAVDPVGSYHLSLCRSSPVRDVRRDLIGAWPRP